MPRVRVRLVSLLRDAARGRRELEVELPGKEAGLAELLQELGRQFPGLVELIKQLEERGLNIVYFVNGKSVDGDVKLRDGDVVSILPPASGG